MVVVTIQRHESHSLSRIIDRGQCPRQAAREKARAHTRTVTRTISTENDFLRACGTLCVVHTARAPLAHTSGHTHTHVLYSHTHTHKHTHWSWHSSHPESDFGPLASLKKLPSTSSPRVNLSLSLIGRKSWKVQCYRVLQRREGGREIDSVESSASSLHKILCHALNIFHLCTEMHQGSSRGIDRTWRGQVFVIRAGGPKSLIRGHWHDEAFLFCRMTSFFLLLGTAGP